ncbi:MAG: cytochrome-c peroxidase [Candidatus Angelobacter sp.]
MTQLKKLGSPMKVFMVLLAGFGLMSIKAFSAPDDARPVPAITPEMVDSMNVLPGGLTALPAVPIPAASPQTPAKIALGEHLFFDRRLSLDYSSSCATCHAPDKAFTDGLPRAKGFKGALGQRNSPTVLNAAYNDLQFWDGRAASLDEQCKGPLLNPAEMNMVDEKNLVDRLNAVPEYRRDFQQVFGRGPSLDNVAHAIAAFERTLVTPNARFDRYAQGDKNALTAQEKRGLIVFFGKAACSECHKGPNFTDNKFHSLGIAPLPGNPNDLGRFAVTNRPEDRGAFKTPSLRNIALTAPYMHDGSSATLEDVIDLYDRGGGDGPNKDKLVYKLNLTDEEKSDLIAFLKTLNGELPKVQPPQMYGQNTAKSAGGQGR